jgi:hypothetical protein
MQLAKCASFGRATLQSFKAGCVSSLLHKRYRVSLQQVTPTQHSLVINELNECLASANDPYKSVVDNTVAILSLYLSTYLYKSHYQKVRSQSLSF